MLETGYDEQPNESAFELHQGLVVEDDVVQLRAHYTGLRVVLNYLPTALLYREIYAIVAEASGY